VNVSLLEQLALQGRGTADFVRPEESVERAVGLVAKRLVDPVLTDVRVTVDGPVRLSKLLPAQPSDVFADRDLVVLSRYSGHGRARVWVEGTRRGTPVRWSTEVDFPDRERQNPFVARIWAAQRVGYLSAEKRRNGGSAELDEEIRMLGERYSIPTEFTSYLVTEPQLNRGVLRQAAGVGGVMPTSMPAPAAARFESAKAASAQRALSTVAAMDSMTAASERRDAASTMKRVNARRFLLTDGVWTDERYTAGMPKVSIKPFGKAYFDLVAELPELRDVFAIGERVIVVGRDRAIEVSDHGIDSMSSAERAALIKAW